MRAPSLRETLGLITMLAAACGGRVASEASSGTTPGSPEATPSPRHDDECPHVVELRGFDLSVAGYDACELASRAPGCFRAFCQPAAADCATACGDPTVNACALPPSLLVAFKADTDRGFACMRTGATLDLHCAVTEIQGTKQSGCPIEGRRPHGLIAQRPQSTPRSVGEYLAECEWLEAASVVAFRELALSLRDVGAPQSLRDACNAAASEEERHVVSVGALARRFGGRVRGIEVSERRTCTPFDLARENVVEGVVRETFGAAVALWRGAHATDLAVREAMKEIAEEECRHAELAVSIAAFLDGLLTSEEREAIESARVIAIDELYASFVDDHPIDVIRVVGVPRAMDAHAILDGLGRMVWGSRSARGLRRAPLSSATA
jgi:hypothetical protein